MLKQQTVVEEKLDTIAAADPRVQLLRTIPGVGPRLSEAIVALLDRPERFRNASQGQCSAMALLGNGVLRSLETLF